MMRRSAAGDELMEEQIPGSTPRLDDLGVLRTERGWISLSRVQEKIMRLLVDHFGHAVSRNDLAEAVWPDGGRNLHTIDIHIHRLRPRLSELGLVIHTLRGRGFLLESRAA
jgi:DNA-binding winged helix-turn-helix (wHTH) protein